VINQVNAGLEVLRKKDEVFVNLTKYNRVDGISWLNQVLVACPKLSLLWIACEATVKVHHIRSWLES
jgi:hypothetical protein